ncbi:hypothetical protein TPHA_0A03840 [Tetrapisispora phaffii CBS 4417]|uniref:CCAAT-binding factor domain-containing protein n=1 Tax=Tetrapisispora phaffii (strain ATCC 24235 / CBS 4417 / NBRC 1672 / NRRL Y-8282 / UCD 70-5) TaxID=1071381 RepID=G8BNI2_TETPH|nr:hypothetical protein TPHA_0A03840 [Tetrapisispora phaffii CBS 4417]CCE61460.1 hypothetical protein TPHA_0A03840 [Tetrapisispora phaffii CBS 4417]
MSGSVDLSALKEKVSSKLKSSNMKQKDKKPTKSFKTENKIEDEELRHEALALGASEKDLELIGDDQDDDLSEQEFGADEGEEEEEFKDDLQKFMKNIGLDKHVQEGVEEEESLSSTKEEQVEEEEPESDEEEQEQEQEDEEIEESEPETKENSNSKSKDFVADLHMVRSDKLIVPIETAWYNVELDPKIEKNIKNDYIKLNKEQIEKLLERGKQVLEKDNQTYYQEFSKDSSQRKFMSQILSDGTLNDKISAVTLLIQEAPLHNTKSIDTLMSYCNKKSRNSVLQSLNALKDLLLNGLLPDRKLRYFKNQPGLSTNLNDRTLAIFYFEDYLKKTFFSILEILEKLSHDPIIHVRNQVLNHIFDFISAKPEQEFNLLKLGVNKLGDIDSKVASKTSHLLLKLEQAHPNMKSVIIDSIVDTILRPNSDYHATYYAVITLNQTILRKFEDEVANKLIKTYFTLFEKFLLDTDKDNAENKDIEVKSDARGYENKRKKNFKKGKNGGKSVKNEQKTEEEVISEKNSKLFSALLTGVNRSFPFAQLASTVYEPHLDTLFKITHSSNFNTSIQALVLINQVTFKAKLNSDRYYKTLYESLLDPRLISSSKQGIYLNLLYKSLKRDTGDIARVEAFVKRILQVSLHWLNAGTIAGFLYLLIQLIKVFPEIKNLLTNTIVDHEYASDNEEESSIEKKVRVYDPRKRDPKFANADKASLWEITDFLNHYHPTVQTYASAIVNASKSKKEDINKIENDEDNIEIVKPDLGLFTLTHFLDRFVYRNAKTKTTTKGGSIMQPLFGGSQINDSLLVKSTDNIDRVGEAPMNSIDWLNTKVSNIKPDEKFFYQYFSNKKSAIRKHNKDSSKRDTFDEDSDLDETEIWDALVKSRPDIEEDSEDDLDLSMSDFTDSENEDEDIGAIEGMSDDDEEEGREISDNEAKELEAMFNQDITAVEDVNEEGKFDSSDEDEDEQFYSFRDEENDIISSSSSEEEEEVEQKKPGNMKRKHENSDPKETTSNKKQDRKKEIKKLPLFASAEDYAQYLNSDED